MTQIRRRTRGANERDHARPTISCSARAQDAMAFWSYRQFVYFIQEGDDGPVKIGTATSPTSRLVGLQCGNPTLLHLRELIVADPATERTLHGHWRQAKIRGEWFGQGRQQEILERAALIADYQREEHEAGTDYWDLVGRVLVKAMFAPLGAVEDAA